MVYIDFLRWKVGFEKNGLSIMNMEDTYSYILKNKISVCRFGDGELALIKGKWGPKFQTPNPELISRLKEILSKSDSCQQALICIPYALTPRGRFGLTKEAATFWCEFAKRMSFDLYKMLHGNSYGNAHITRPYMDYKKTDENYLKSLKYFSSLGRLWRGGRTC